MESQVFGKVNNMRSVAWTISTTSDTSGHDINSIDPSCINSTSNVQKAMNGKRNSAELDVKKRNVKIVKRLALTINIVGVVACCALLVHRTTICIEK